MKLFILNFLISLIVYSTQAQIVNTTYGQISGSLNGTVHQFLGIPFAKAPLDTLRWKAPQEPATWAGVLSTTSFAPVCPQKHFNQGDTTYTLEGNEDCLYLNVWTPAVGAGSRPVLVFIHGGGNQQGGASETGGGTQMFFGKNMSARGDAVVVTIQYRLGPLGFLVHPGLELENANSIAGNYAVLDQILALTWVKNNIANFGGDASKVMIFGESAGGVDVANLLTSPLAAGLFQRACIQSAVPMVGDYTTVKNKGIAFVDSFTSVGTPAQKITYMRALSADSIISGETAPLSGGAVQMNWQAVKDDVVFTDFPFQSFQSGNFNKVPLMLGSNADEMSLSVPPVVIPAMVTALINSSVPSALRAQANILYPPGSTNAEAKASYIGILTDAQFTATVRRTAQCVSQNQTEPVWRYFFTHKHTFAPLTPLGSYHGMELFYVFNNWENATAGTGVLFKPADDSVQQAMLNYWVNFARTGNPNASGMEAWPVYNSSTDCYLEIKATPNGTACGLRTAQSDLWDDAINFVPCTSSVNISETNDFTQLQVYPNPTDAWIHIARNDGKTDFSCELFDLAGQSMLQTFDREAFDMSPFAAGVYVLKVNQDAHSSFVKVVRK